MNMHAFNVDVANDYGLAKAVLLQNIYYWCCLNKANNQNIYNGKAYTYNTADAFSKILTYLTPRKIAELLRQLEADELIISKQLNGLNRVKSYTLTDKAIAYYTSINNISNTTNSGESNNSNGDIATYTNTTIEDTNVQLCSITDNKHTDINTYINNSEKHKNVSSNSESSTTKKPQTKKEFIPPTESEVKSYCDKMGYKVDAHEFVNWYTDPESGKWIDANGKEVKNWKQKLRQWSCHNNNNGNGGKSKSYYQSAIEKSGCDKWDGEEVPF